MAKKTIKKSKKSKKASTPAPSLATSVTPATRRFRLRLLDPRAAAYVRNHNFRIGGRMVKMEQWNRYNKPHNQDLETVLEAEVGSALETYCDDFAGIEEVA